MLRCALDGAVRPPFYLNKWLAAAHVHIRPGICGWHAFASPAWIERSYSVEQGRHLCCRTVIRTSAEPSRRSRGFRPLEHSGACITRCYLSVYCRSACSGSARCCRRLTRCGSRRAATSRMCLGCCRNGWTRRLFQHRAWCAVDSCSACAACT